MFLRRTYNFTSTFSISLLEYKIRWEKEKVELPVSTYHTVEVGGKTLLGVESFCLGFESSVLRLTFNQTSKVSQDKLKLIKLTYLGLRFVVWSLSHRVWVGFCEG